MAELGFEPKSANCEAQPREEGGENAGTRLGLPSLPSPSLLRLPLADLLVREAQLAVTIGNVKGVLDTSILDPEPGPQGPFITYSYYVTYDFVEDEEGEVEKSKQYLSC